MDFDMQNRIVRIDKIHSRAICNEVAERLRVTLSKDQSEISTDLINQLDRLWTNAQATVGGRAFVAPVGGLIHCRDIAKYEVQLPARR
jgi:hypothetical protein